jgi:1-deoxy-D-xylulose-5-phosphate reductoisomerase
MNKKRVILLGATGSIGEAALDVLRAYTDLFSLTAISANRSIDKLCRIMKEFSPDAVSLVSPQGEMSELVSSKSDFYPGPGALLDMIDRTDADIVVNGISGAAGLLPSWHAICSGKDLALANKETIVTAGPLILAEAGRRNKNILPVDSEHSAIFELMQHRNHDDIEELILTASGGPFRERPLETFQDISLKESLSHPTWDMGHKISIDSATMANKGLELMEAQYLFGIPGESIKVLIHPQSMVHSLIRTRDGSMYAQISKPDMRVPIQNALTWPECLHSTFGRLDLAGEQLSFFHPETERYPLLYLAKEALRGGPAYCIAYNAADEVAVEAFYQNRIAYTGIAEMVRRTLDFDWSAQISTIGDVLETDRRAREKCAGVLEGTGGKR